MRALLILPALYAIACDCESRSKAPAKPEIVAPTPVATASVPAPAEAAPEPGPYPARTTTKWPLDTEKCSFTPCKLPDGAPGLTCTAGQACFNPCPDGTGPERDHWSCAKLCRSNADCGKDPCVNGVCDRWPKHACKAPDESCTTADGEMGFRCSAKHECKPMCKRGLAAYGGTHCAKKCKTNAECPGGTCEEGFCVPLCPSEGCPYRWE